MTEETKLNCERKNNDVLPLQHAQWKMTENTNQQTLTQAIVHTRSTYMQRPIKGGDSARTLYEVDKRDGLVMFAVDEPCWAGACPVAMIGQTPQPNGFVPTAGQEKMLLRVDVQTPHCTCVTWWMGKKRKERKRKQCPTVLLSQIWFH